MELHSLSNRRFVFTLMLVFITLFGVILPGTAIAQTSESVIETDDVFVRLYEEVSPSVVAISVVSRQPNTGLMNPDQTVIGGGTGFVIDNQGHIMTNNHVVDGASEIEVSFIDGTLASADVIGLDPDSDLAVIKVDLPDDQLAQLRPVTFGDSEAINIGQTVLAIGSPFGQRWTLTSGIVSAVERSIQGLTTFSIGGVIQTDAAINPGNSGGPLLNLNGEVIGVNSQIISGSGSNSGVGFAVPGNLANRVGQRLIDDGFVNYSYVGISGRDVYLPLIEKFNIPNNTQGVVVMEAVPGGPADRADIQNATFATNGEPSNGPRVAPDSVDVITAIDGEPLSGISDLISYLAANTQPGDTVTMTVLRLDENGSQELQIDVRLTPRP